MSAEPPVLLASARVVDGEGDLAPVLRRVEALRRQGRVVETLTIAPLSDPWGAPPDPSGRRFKSGCAPIQALARARERLATGAVDAVVIRGREPLRTGYSREARQAHMAIWPGVSVPEAYTDLADAWMARHGIDESAFRALADGLLDNYRRTAEARGLAVDLAAARQRHATRLFRYADCANPYLDFEGAALLVRASVERPPGSGVDRRLRLLGVAVAVQPDGPSHVATLAGYAHLRRAYEAAVREARVDVPGLLGEGRALLEVYTCFPPVPLGFLLASGLAGSVKELAALLEAQPITVTGGMNLARAPWNNPVLNALVVMHEQLLAGKAEVGLLHGNGGLGGWQGVAVLGRAETR